MAFRQIDVAIRAGVSQSTVSRLESGQIGRVAVDDIRAVLGVLDARLGLTMQWRGAAIDRVNDEGHALLSGIVVATLVMLAWEVHTEVSYSHFGDRGWIDILAWHPASQTLLVIEIKTEIGSMEDLGRRIDTKVRLAGQIAAERFGWKAAAVSRLVVLPEDRSVRRIVQRHSRLLGASFPQRNHAVRAWLREPVGHLSGLWFVTDMHRVGLARNPSAVQRISATRRSVPHAPKAVGRA